VQIATALGVYQDMHKAFVGHIYGEKTYEQMKEDAYNGLKGGLTKLSGLLGDKEWFCSKFSYVDIVLGDTFQVYSLFHEKFAEDFPTLKALQERVWNLEGINQYVKSERFKERPINFLPYAKWV
jgi:glutathione S-transferase